MTTRKEFIKKLASTALATATSPYLASCASTKTYNCFPKPVFDARGSEKIVSVKFAYLNTAACFGISVKDEKGKETRILLDPSDFGLEKRFEEYKNADLIAVSHGHGDHVNKIPEIITENKKTKVICPPGAREIILSGIEDKEIKERVYSCNNKYRTNISSSLELQMLPSSHVVYDLGLTIDTMCKAFWNQGQLDKYWSSIAKLWDTLSANTTYSPVLTFNDKSIMHMGSLGTSHFPIWKKMKRNNQLPSPDVLLLAYMGLEDEDMKKGAFKIINLLEPKKVIIHHHLAYLPQIKPFVDAIKPHSFAQELGRRGIEAVVASPGQEFYIKL